MEIFKLKRIVLLDYEASDCEWPGVPEFSVEIRRKFDLYQMQKLLPKLTELTVTSPCHIDLVIPMHLENLSVLKFKTIDDYNLH